MIVAWPDHKVLLLLLFFVDVSMTLELTQVKIVALRLTGQLLKHNILKAKGLIPVTASCHTAPD